MMGKAELEKVDRTAWVQRERHGFFVVMFVGYVMAFLLLLLAIPLQK